MARPPKDWRSTKAQKQTRDRFGRWITTGASVRWLDNGVETSGLIKSSDGSNVVVSTMMPDGRYKDIQVPAGNVSVIASKARLVPDAAKMKAKEDSFYTTIQSPEYKKILEDAGIVSVTNGDGYQMTVSEKKPKDGSNPWIYQLYAPGGRSLGEYGEDAVQSFDDMVAEDKAGDSNPYAEEPVAAAGDVVMEDNSTPYTVPKDVKQSILSALDGADEDSPAHRIATASAVSRADVEWINEFFINNVPEYDLHGGYAGKKWAEKILDQPEDHDEFGEDLDYYAVGQEEGSSYVDTILAVDPETEEVYRWDDGTFTLLHGILVVNIDEPQIIPIDADTARDLARTLNEEECFDLLQMYPEEKALFDMAESEFDFEDLDRLGAILSDASYSPLERSINARKQSRGAGGRFGSGGSTAAPSEKESGAKKATLSEALPLVEDPAALINLWIQDANEAPLAAAATPEEAAASDSDALYFAIVDEVDTTAVMDVVAITKENGGPHAYLRQNGAWVSSPETLSDLQGTTPPPVVALEVPEPAKGTLAQVDQYDQDGGSEPAEETPIAASAVPEKNREEAAKKGYALPDGSYPIFNVEDLKNAVQAIGRAKNPTKAKQHIRKRAKALNRMDLVPEEWRNLSLMEIGELEAEEGIFGEFGEVFSLTAAGATGVKKFKSAKSMRNYERLKHYWLYGRGAAKVRYLTPGDLTRLQRHLVKYLHNPSYAWATAHKWYMEKYHVSNTKMDKATGQYRPRGRKKR